MGKGDLNQRSTAAWLRKATSEREVEEVLSAYVFCKMRSGSTPTGAVRKLHLLICYLYALELGYLVDQYRGTWQLIQSEVQHYDGGLIGATPCTSPLAHSLWNEVRRGNPTPRSPLGLSLFRTLSRTSSLGGGGDEPPARVRVREGAAATPESEINMHWGGAGPGAALLLRSARPPRSDWEGPRGAERRVTDEGGMAMSRLPTYEPGDQQQAARDSVDELPLYA